MNNIISLEQVADYDVYNPILTLSEDLDYDNRFCVIHTNMGNVAFSYYDLGIAPDYIIQDTTLFLSFGKGYYILDLKDKCTLCKFDDSLSVIFEIIKFDVQSCIVFVGEMSLICFSLEGNFIWRNSYRNTIFDWSVTDKGLYIVFENYEKWIISLKDGNGIRIE
ncbi:MAG: hypothetical protein K2M78_00210 [Lachnospiraceae bacterium]|nr:hypothetical protein [Lachnospiraceae bacterium]